MTGQPRAEDIKPPDRPRTLTDIDHRAMATAIPPLPTGSKDGMRVVHHMQSPITYFGHWVEYPHEFDVLLEDVTGQPEPTIWMSATPQEFTHIIDLLDSLPETGRLFMSGLGLGVALRLGGDRIKHATVVERDERLVDLVWKHIERPGWELVVSDVEEYLLANASQHPEEYDIIYLDTWDSGDFYLLGWATKLARLAQPMLAVGGRTVLWTYDQMVSDLRNMLTMVSMACVYGLMSRQADPGLRDFAVNWPPLAPFARWCLAKPRTPKAVAAEIEAEILRWCNGEREGTTPRT